MASWCIAVKVPRRAVSIRRPPGGPWEKGGYYASWRYQTPLGTIGGIAGLALCVIGTSHGHEGNRRRDRRGARGNWRSSRTPCVRVVPTNIPRLPPGRYQTPLGTIGGIAGLALCVIGTSHGHEGGH
jgi:hypothetical protein